MGLFYTNVKNETNHKHAEKIFHEEKRAPTDDSIRLYREIEEKIHQSIAQKLIVNNNLFTYSIYFRNDYLNASMGVKIKINENEFSEVFKIDSEKNPDQIVKILKDWLCEKILMNPIRSILEEILSNQMNGYRVINT